MLADPDRLEDSLRIGRVAIGEDEFAARQARERAAEPLIPAHSVKRDGVDIVEELARIHLVMLHQAGERRSMLMEMGLLDALGFVRTASEQALDIGAHPLIDQRKQSRRRRVKAIVEIEDPISDVGEARVHHRESH
jgi:hypothetical protein